MLGTKEQYEKNEGEYCDAVMISYRARRHGCVVLLCVARLQGGGVEDGKEVGGGGYFLPSKGSSVGHVTYEDLIGERSF